MITYFKTSLLYFFFLFNLFNLNAQWTYQKNVVPFTGDLIITYDVIYEKKLTEQQKKHPAYIDEIVVNFNKKNLLVERVFKHKIDNNFKLFNYSEKKAYSCYTSSGRKLSTAYKFQEPKTETALQKGKQKKIAGITCDVSLVTQRGKSYEICHTKRLGLRYPKNFNVDGFILEYPGYHKFLGAYKIIAKQITNHQLSDVVYSLKGYYISEAEDLVERHEKYKETSNEMIGSTVPKYKFKTLTNKEYNSKEMTGKVVVFNFWFTTCPPCKSEIPVLNDLKKKYKDNDDVVFIAIALDPTYKLLDFFKTTRFDYDIVANGNKISALRKLKITAYPTNIIVDKNGIIQHYHVGGVSKGSIHNISRKIDEALIAPLKS